MRGMSAMKQPKTAVGSRIADIGGWQLWVDTGRLALTEFSSVADRPKLATQRAELPAAQPPFAECSVACLDSAN